MNKAAFRPFVALVVLATVFSLVWLSTKPGDHTLFNTGILTFVGVWLRLEYNAMDAKADATEAKVNAQQATADAQQAKSAVIETDQKIERYHTEVNGKMHEMMENLAKQKFAEGAQSGREEEAMNERLRNTLLKNKES